MHLVAAAVLLGAAGGAASPAPPALAECRRLVEARDFVAAIPRCEEAVALDFGLAEAHFLLGRAHAVFAAPPREGSLSALLTDAQREAHRKKAMESYRRFLAVGSDPAAGQLRAAALGDLLGLYVLADEVDEALLPFADELAQEPSLPFEHLIYLSATYERHRRYADSERFSRKALEVNPTHTETCLALAATQGRPVWNGESRFDDMIATLERCAGMTPRDPIAYFRLASLLWHEAYGDKTLSDARRAAYLSRGLVHVDNALAIDPDYLEAVVYKGLLLRLKALDSGDTAERERLLEEARALQQRGAALKSAGVKLREDPYAAFFTPAPPPPPTPIPSPEPMPSLAPPPPSPRPAGPVRVGGAIKEPKKIEHANPVYPMVAREARIQGVVILECVIGADGKVKDIRVLRGIPLLDQAAVDAVRRWEYEPTSVDGVAVPVIMTITVHFRLS